MTLRRWGAAVLAVTAAACGASSRAADGADLDRPAEPSMELVSFTDVAADAGLTFRHGAFQWGASGDPAAMMGGGLCWIDVDRDGWLDLFVVNTWSDGEWGRWRGEGALPSTRLFRNERGRFTDITDEMNAGLEVRGVGCVAADLDLDGHTDLYVTTERENVLLWNVDGDRFDVDDGSAGADLYGWHTAAAVGDVDGDGWPDLYVAGYADLNRRITGATKGFPNTYEPEPDMLLISQGADEGERPSFVDGAVEAGIESTQLDYGLGAVFTDVDRDGDLDLYTANDTQPNRLYINDRGGDGPVLTDRGAVAGIADDNAGMGVASADYDGDGRPDLVVTNLGEQGHRVFRSLEGEGEANFRSALDELGIAALGTGRTGWGTTWSDIDLDGDLDLLLAHGAIPITDLEADREQLQLYENRAAGATADFIDVTATVGLDESGRHLARGLAAADYDNDGDLDLAVGTIGGDLALLRNTGAGGHWLTVAAEPATPGTRVTVTDEAGTVRERELMAGSSYLSSEDPRAHFGLGASGEPVGVRVAWPDGSVVTLDDVATDRILPVERQ